jgi:hypothetical protein
MLFRVTITLRDYSKPAWAEALERGYERADTEADIAVVIREDLLCAIASFEYDNPYAAGELARGWFEEAADAAGFTPDTQMASWDVLAVAPEYA